MKHVSLIGKFITLMSFFGIFVTATAFYSAINISSIDEDYGNLLDRESKATLMLARANRSIQAAHAAIADLLIARTEDTNTAALSAFERQRKVSSSASTLPSLPCRATSRWRISSRRA